MASTVNFVHIIQQYPCLYNNRIAEYARKDVTDKAWSEVAQSTNSTVSECQAKWKNIRNGFVRSLKPTASGTSTKQKKLYYLHEELQFILPFIKAAIHTGEPGHTPEVAVEDVESNSSIKEEPSTSNTFNASCSKPVLNRSKKLKVRKVPSNVDRAFINWIKKKECNNDNPRKMFLLSLLPDIDNLSEEQMRKFRIKVLLLLEEIQTSSPR